MKNYKNVKVHSKELVSIRCDVCGTTYYREKALFEFSEMHSLDFSSGHGSVFGDMVHCELDICQHCLKEKLGQWIQREQDWGDTWKLV